MRTLLLTVICIIGIGMPGMSAAQSRQACLTQCAGDKASNEQTCPPSGEMTDKGRQQCLERYHTAYEACLNACPAPTPPPPKK